MRDIFLIYHREVPHNFGHGAVVPDDKGGFRAAEYFSNQALLIAVGVIVFNL